ncbi:hypothetical protein [Methylobacterium symbioticum]|uniref:hypothetical protein n=1 Tax=Methylobacterium symbioticum TaxID=2584084 RepID=UPI001627EAF7|nr:hypothetical protein [Methylobacterium symbioticum]
MARRSIGAFCLKRPGIASLERPVAPSRPPEPTWHHHAVLSAQATRRRIPDRVERSEADVDAGSAKESALKQ